MAIFRKEDIEQLRSSLESNTDNLELLSKLENRTIMSDEVEDLTDRVGEEFAENGLDTNDEPTPYGIQLEGLLDKLYLIVNARKALEDIIAEYKLKGYEELARMADANFITTEHPLGEDGVQIGISVFYDDKATKRVRCSFSLYEASSHSKWWKFWDSPVESSDFIVAQDDSVLE